MKTLLIYPKCPDTFWNSNPILNIASKKSTIPPKDLLLISIFLPITWERKIVDLNEKKLNTKDILWADYIFISANENQYKSTVKCISRLTSYGKKIVACGSLFTEYFEEFENIEHLVLDNIRTTMPQFINDLENETQKKFIIPIRFLRYEKQQNPTIRYQVFQVHSPIIFNSLNSGAKIIDEKKS